MNIEILKDGAVYVGGVLDQELTKKNRAFYRQKLSALLDEIVEEIVSKMELKSKLDSSATYNLALEEAAAIVKAKK